jgi:hypothetical protein
MRDIKTGGRNISELRANYSSSRNRQAFFSE